MKKKDKEKIKTLNLKSNQKKAPEDIGLPHNITIQSLLYTASYSGIV